jgi:hypothetical protein
MEAIAKRSSEDVADEPGDRPGGMAAREPEVLARVAALACRVMAVQEAVVLLRRPGGRGALVTAARHGGQGDVVTRAAGLRRGNAAVRRALDRGLPAAETGSGLSAAAPLMVGGEPRGVLVVVGAAPGRPFDGARLELLTDLAELAAASLVERDLRARAEAILEAGVDVLARAVDMRDDYTGRHSADVGTLARRVGERLGMAAADLALLEFAARLHDVGKLSVPDAILQKPGPLDDGEWQVMRRHPEWGAEMVARVPGLEELAALVGAHHEHFDGSGYPRGLAGERIPLASRVISACDAYEAMISRRPYRAPLSAGSALRELVASAGTHFDPAVVAAVEVEIGGPARA